MCEIFRSEITIVVKLTTCCMFQQSLKGKCLFEGANVLVQYFMLFKLLLLQIMRLLIYSFFVSSFLNNQVPNFSRLHFCSFPFSRLYFLILSCSHDCISRLVDHVVHVTYRLPHCLIASYPFVTTALLTPRVSFESHIAKHDSLFPPDASN
jgi:hypothetical protein